MLLTTWMKPLLLEALTDEPTVGVDIDRWRIADAMKDADLRALVLRGRCSWDRHHRCQRGCDSDHPGRATD